MPACLFPDFQNELPQFEAAVQEAGTRLRRWIARHPEQFPVCTSSGQWQSVDALHAGPAAGSLTGMMWVLFESLQEAFWRERAEEYCRLIDTAWSDCTAPGVGFAYYYGGSLSWNESLTREGQHVTALRERLVAVGRAQAAMFRTPGDYLASHADGRLLTIERMLDVPAILAAAGETQDSGLFDLAARHCATTRRLLVRGDGSICSAARMDPATGAFCGPVARAGYRADSTWARGQAWGILGFATAGRLLGFEPWLQTARQAAQFFVERLSVDLVPAWDFDAPAEPPPIRDSAAAAVGAAALFDLAEAEQTIGPDQARARRRLQEVALRILERLCGPEYLARANSPDDGLLLHAVGNLPAGWAVDESLIWGDAFLVRALHRALRLLRVS